MSVNCAQHISPLAQSHPYAKIKQTPERSKPPAGLMLTLDGSLCEGSCQDHDSAKETLPRCLGRVKLSNAPLSQLNNHFKTKLCKGLGSGMKAS